MNDEDWMKKRSWRKNSGCAFVLLGVIGVGMLQSHLWLVGAL